MSATGFVVYNCHPLYGIVFETTEDAWDYVIDRELTNNEYITENEKKRVLLRKGYQIVPGKIVVTQ